MIFLGYPIELNALCFKRYLNIITHRFWRGASLCSIEGTGHALTALTVFPFSGGRSLVWDCTCVDTFAGVGTPESVSNGSWHSCKQRRGAP